MNVGEYVQCLTEILASCLSSSIYLVFCVWLIILVTTLTLITPTNVRYYRPQHFTFAADGPDISVVKSTSGCMSVLLLGCVQNILPLRYELEQ